jgi:hypothetical protein
MRDERENSLKPPPSIEEPACFLYEQYCKTLRESGSVRSMKPWGQIAAMERQAWRDVLGLAIDAGGKVPITKPEQGEVALTMAQEDAYATTNVPAEKFKRARDIGPILGRLQAEVDRRLQDRPVIRIRGVNK